LPKASQILGTAAATLQTLDIHSQYIPSCGIRVKDLSGVSIPKFKFIKIACYGKRNIPLPRPSWRDGAVPERILRAVYPSWHCGCGLSKPVRKCS
jgi:hypothetical protein